VILNQACVEFMPTIASYVKKDVRIALWYCKIWCFIRLCPGTKKHTKQQDQLMQ